MQLLPSEALSRPVRAAGRSPATTRGVGLLGKEVAFMASKRERHEGPRWWVRPVLTGIVKAVSRLVLDCWRNGWGPS